MEHILKVENGIEYAAQFDGDLIHPYKWPDEALEAIGKMLRSLHDASGNYPISCDDTWQPWSLRELGGKHRICCHSDFAPWNVLTVNGMPHRIMDWEYAGPMDPFVELARVCWLFVQLHDDDMASLYNLPSAEKRAQQVRIVCDAYGLSADMRAKLVEQIMEVVMNECANGSTGIAFEDEGSLWYFAWRTRSLYWIWKNREVLNAALY